MKVGVYISFSPIYLNKFEIDKNNKNNFISLDYFGEELIKEANGYNVILLTKENINFLPKCECGTIKSWCFFQATKKQAIEYHIRRDEFELAKKIKKRKNWKQNSDLIILGNPKDMIPAKKYLEEFLKKKGN